VDKENNFVFQKKHFFCNKKSQSRPAIVYEPSVVTNMSLWFLLVCAKHKPALLVTVHPQFLVASIYMAAKRQINDGRTFFLNPVKT
jgi:hypothetical protein